MALLCFNSLPSVFSFASTTTPFIIPASALPVPRLHAGLQLVVQNTSSIYGISIGDKINTAPHKRATAVIVKVAADDAAGSPDDSSEKAVQVDKLPLESKEQQKMEQKIKMKLAKKIRLRRKRLLRKRRMRKKGRWPPSKMNKLKNV